MPEKKKLLCFVVSPIGSPDSEIRAEADWVLKYLIRPALEADYDVKRADEFAQPDVITNLVILSIKNADLVVVDLTDHNPNVFYELALAHMLNKPVVPLIKVDQRIPFDNQAMGTIHYSRARIDLWEKAIAGLKNAASETRQPGYKVNNPVTLALGVEQLKLSGDTKDQVIAELREGLQRVSREIDQLKQAKAAPSASEAAVYLARPVDPHSAVSLHRSLYSTDVGSRPAGLVPDGVAFRDPFDPHTQRLLNEAKRVLERIDKARK